MKQIYFSVLVLLFTLPLFSQNFIESNYKNYLDREDITRVQLGEKAFQMAATLTKNTNDPDAAKAHKLISKVKSFDLLVIDNQADAVKAFQAGNTMSKGFEDLIRIKSEDANVAIKIKESNNVISEIIGLIAADSEFIVFNLVGEIDLEEISELTKHVNNETIDKVFNSGASKFKEVKAYPNPVKKGSNATIEVSDEMIGGKLSVMTVDGKQVASFSLNDKQINLETSKLNAASYILKFENNSITINKKLIVIE